MPATVVSVAVVVGEVVSAGATLVILESMKMEQAVTAGVAGTIRTITVDPGDTVAEGDPLVILDAGAAPATAVATEPDPDPEAIRPELAELTARRALVVDEGRPDVVARRHARGGRTARENVTSLCDPDSFVEYGSFVVAAQRRRRPVDDLIRRTPADGLVGGIGRVNGDRFDDVDARCAVLAYDYTVLAGTQGLMNHRKRTASSS